MSSWTQIEAEKAFSAATRARLRASLTRRLRGCAGACARLAVHDERTLRSGAGLGLREIPLDAISGTVEPNRAAQFDRDFRPAAPAACAVAERLDGRAARHAAAADLGRRGGRRLRRP